MNENLSLWTRVARPPADALKRISGGRLGGMTDISPQWRIKIMTEVCGPVGVGWTYEIQRLWTEPGSEGQVCAFAQVAVRYRNYAESAEWSAAVPGIGGSMLIANEKNGAYTSDEAYKMAVTDALSVALKALGVAADVYLGLWDGSKYKTPTEDPEFDETSRRHKKALEAAGTHEELKAVFTRLYKASKSDAERTYIMAIKDRCKDKLAGGPDATTNA